MPIDKVWKYRCETDFQLATKGSAPTWKAAYDKREIANEKLFSGVSSKLRDWKEEEESKKKEHKMIRISGSDIRTAPKKSFSGRGRGGRSSGGPRLPGPPVSILKPPPKKLIDVTKRKK